MSDTPETDALESECEESGDCLDPFRVMIEHAQCLERERNASQAECRKMRQAIAEAIRLGALTTTLYGFATP